MWEKAIKLSKELAETYESKVFDYEGLGNLLVSPGQNISSFQKECENQHSGTCFRTFEKVEINSLLYHGKVKPCSKEK